MGRIVVGIAATAREDGFPSLVGIRGSGHVRSDAVIGGPKDPARPLFFWVHELDAGAKIAFDGSSPMDHVFYVLDGSVDCGEPVTAESAFIIEHGATACIRSDHPARLAHFHRRQDHERTPARSGGSVGLCSDGSPEGRDTRTGMLYRIFLDSKRSTSDAWLHRTDFPDGHKGVPHFHTTDEIIFVTSGQLRVGTNRYPVGTALAIDDRGVYSFAAGDTGVGFINFRAEHSERIGVTRDGRTPPMEESGFLRSLPEAPPGGWAAIRRPTDDERAGSGKPHYLDDTRPPS